MGKKLKITKKAMDTAQLQDIGLSERETKIYLTLLNLEKATVHEISRHTSINRSTVYLDIESLLEKRLISEIESQKKKYYVPESPEQLLEINKSQKKQVENVRGNIESLLPDLIDSFTKSSTKPIVRFFEGKEGITVIREEMLLSKNKEVQAIVSYPNLRNIYDKDYLEDYSSRRIHNKIKMRIIYNDKEDVVPLSKYRSTTKYKNINTLTEKPENIQSDVYMFDGKVAIMSISKQPYSGVIIDNAAIYNTFQELFNVLWKNKN